MPGNTAKYPTSAATIADLTVATNRASTTLSSTINNSATTIPVASVGLFTAPCIIYIEAEAVFAGTAASGSFTGCVRGFDNTTAAGHNSGVTVENLIAAYHHNQPAAEIVAIEADLFNGLTGDVTRTAGTSTTTLANIPTGVTMAGQVIASNISAPTTPASGKTAIYAGSTGKVLSAKNDAGTVSITVQPNAGTAGSFVTALGTDGSLTLGTVGASALPQFTGGNVTTTAAGSVNLIIGSLPADVPAAGDIDFTNIAAPTTPSSGFTRVYIDSSDKNLKAKNDTGAITVTVTPVTATAGTFITGLATGGVFTVGTAAANVTPVTATAGTFLTAVTSAGSFTVGTAIKAVTATAGTFITAVNAQGTFSVGTAITAVTATAGTFLTGVTAAGSFTVGTASSGTGAGASILSGSNSALGTAGTAGNLYMPTDAPVIYRDSGAIQSPWGWLINFTNPGTSTAWTWTNQGSSTIADVKDGLVLFNPANTAFSVQGMVKTAPGSNFTTTVGFLCSGLGGGGSLRMGMMLREAATGKLTVFGLGNSGSAPMVCYVTACATNTTFTSDVLTGNGPSMNGVIFYKTVVDGSNVTYSISADLQNWSQVAQNTITTNFTTKPDQYGFGISAQGTVPIYMRINHVAASTP
jgi:hypothetical protein